MADASLTSERALSAYMTVHMTFNVIDENLRATAESPTSGKKKSIRKSKVTESARAHSYYSS